jgi:predicted dehydrogenase
MSKLRIGILGTGGMAGVHAHRFRENPDVEIVALCDISEDIIHRFIGRHLAEYQPAPEIFTDPAYMYSEANLDGVVIVTPHTLHFDHGLQALEKGCHVLMEKPMVTDSSQAYELAMRAAESGKILTVGYNTPCTPEFKYLRDIVRSKELGNLETVSAWLSQNWKKGTAGSWRQMPELSGGGQMYDSGAHLFNSLVWTVEQPITHVQAFIDNSGTPVDINGSVNIRFSNGALAAVAVNGNCATDGAGMSLCFEDGRVEIDGWGGSWIKVFRGRDEDRYLLLEGTANTPDDNFVDAILGRAEPRTTPANGILQSQLMDAIYESARTGTVVQPLSRSAV